MPEINALPYYGYKAISTFSGGGGSSLGYRMAGFKVVWANEFIPAAQDTYRANYPDTYLDTRDIRKIQPEEILAQVELARGELDLIDGSPPCASFSTAGKRETGWGKVKQYSDTKQRTDDLFFEYARILEGIQPKIFIAENVSGLVKGTAKGYFIEILSKLKQCGYRVEAKLLDAQWLGVPQMRQRIIFIGVRNDLNLAPVFPKPLPYRYSLKDAIGNMNDHGYREKLSPRMAKWWAATPRGETLDYGSRAIGDSGSGMTKQRLSWNRPGNTVLAFGGGTCDYYHPDIPESLTINELKRVCSYPDDFVLTGNFKQQWERLGRSVPPVMMFHIAKTIRDELLCRMP